MRYRLEPFQNGAVSVADLNAGETMHSTIGPWEEAQQIYIEQSQLIDPLSHAGSGPLVIYDVGLGIAANSLATIEFFLRERGRRDVHLISFEKDTSGIRYALQNSEHFPFLERNRSWVEQLLNNEEIRIRSEMGGLLSWELREGDYFKRALEAPSPELVYYDFYSPKACPDLWNLRAFQFLFNCTSDARKRGINTRVLTYSSSTAARAAMLLSGFYVGHGISTRAKKETTVACTVRENLPTPLDLSWGNHLKRSSKPLPPDWEGDPSSAFKEIEAMLQASSQINPI